MAPGKNYTPKDKKFGKSNKYSLEQEYRKGIREKPKYTWCRLKKRVRAKSGPEACIYEGNNQTFELIVDFNCPKNIQCKYNPGGTEPNIDDVVDGLNDAFKNKK